MAAKRFLNPTHGAFAALPVRHVMLTRPGQELAVHRSGRFGTGVPPIVCVAGYHRNMTDFTEFKALFDRGPLAGWPLVLLDFLGRGRSPDRVPRTSYGSMADANDLGTVVTALGIESAIFLGQGYGGQVVMAMAAAHPLLVAATILVDSGPMTDSRGLVRLRSNLRYLEAFRSAGDAALAFRRMLAKDYPALPDEQIDLLSQRTHVIDAKGRPLPLFDPTLITRLEAFEYDDVLAAQWPLFDTLAHAPMMLIRTTLTDQLRRETFEEMIRRRPDAVGVTISGQGSPALLDQAEEFEAIGQFIRQVMSLRRAAR
ncbi:MAG: Pimeloyl-ACP methyl ester carboxylesterase [Devosia sp.]|nr:Pimeloyl-ACP methyl ester carboxylesterase [Devosia sp.]